MTRAGLERIVRVWQKRLKLEHWEVVFNWDRPLDPSESFADVNFASDYDTAILRVASGFEGWSRPLANQVLVHELMHLHERGIHEAFTSIQPLIGKPEYELFYVRARHEREGLVDRLATVLVEVGGVV